MASIDQIIRREVNPFDPATFKPGNFWHEQQPALNVNSIHQEAIAQIEGILDQIAKDHRTRTLVLYGDSGSGKSHLLARLKQTLNAKAFFTYIGPWPDSDFIWRHILRQTVDSLLYVPQGQQESQLLLWLKGLSVFREQGVARWVLGERLNFIRHLRATYPAGIYNAKEFFGVLYDLANPELYPLACDWLRGDDLDEDDLKQLGVKHTIDNENAAQNILANFGRISAQPQPIVLCFDQLDNIPRLPDKSIDLQALFSVNSSIHNQLLKNFLVIISIITNTLKQNGKRIQTADRARVDAVIPLKTITLEQAEALWKSRLAPLHQQAEPQPAEPIYPLNQQALFEKFPGGKTLPRSALMLGRNLFQEYKAKLVIDAPATKPKPSTPAVTRIETDPLAAFKLVWSQEFNKTQQKIARIRQFSVPELIQMLREALDALEVKGIKSRFLPSPTYASYSLSYQSPSQSERFGVVWTEDPNMGNFFHVMNSCQKAIKQNMCQTLYLIRAESLGTTNNQGFKRYQQIFTGSPHCHIKPNLTSVHYLATYHRLVNAACSKELIVGDKTPNLKELEALIRQSKILHDCPLLQDLGIVDRRPPIKIEQALPDLQPVEEFLLSLVKTHEFLGRQTLIQNALTRFSQVNASQVEQLIQQLCQAKQIQIIDPNAKPEAQLIGLVSS